MGRKNTGSIRVRGDFQFQARVTIDGELKGKTCSTRIEAEAWIDGLLKASSEGQTQRWLEAHEITVGAALDRYLGEFTPRKKSVETEERRIRGFIARETKLCAMSLQEVRTTDLKVMIRRRLKLDGGEGRAVTDSTVNRELAFLSHLFTVAKVEWDYADLVNPVVRGLRRKENRARDRRLEEGEEDALLAAARGYERDCSPDIPITAVIQTATDTSMRQSELGTCLWRHVNLREATILLPDTKNGSARTVPLWPSTVRVLAGLERREDGLVFGPTASIRQMWTRVLKRTGCEFSRKAEQVLGGLIT